MEFWTSTLWKYEFRNGKLTPVVIRTFTAPSKNTAKVSKTKKKEEKEIEFSVGKEEVTL